MISCHGINPTMYTLSVHAIKMKDFCLTVTLSVLAFCFPGKVCSINYLPSLEYEAIISFGDSLADTGNFILSNAIQNPASENFPYGETFFKYPTGRFSDGRLMVDFIAEAFGLPYLPPYLGLTNGQDIRQGLNFAVAGATVLDSTFSQEHGYLVVTNDSLSVQLNWFKNIKSSLCTTEQDCDDYFKKTLFLVGEIGGNDYNHAFDAGATITEAVPIVSLVVESIVAATAMLIEEGAVEIMVPGNFPIGCLAVYLSSHQSTNVADYDEIGCLKSYNSFAKYHNDQLKEALGKLRQKYQQARIIYGDYYNAVLPLFKDPQNFGFFNGPFGACCGGGGPYNYNSSAKCGYTGSTNCEDPSTYVNWDGIHLTEAAYRHITQSLINDLDMPLIPRKVDFGLVPRE